jgi:hypothetical protein
MEINNNKYVGYDMLSESDCLYNLQMLFAIMSLLRAYVRHALTSLNNLTCLLCPFILYLYQFTLHVVIIHDFCSCQDAMSQRRSSAEQKFSPPASPSKFLCTIIFLTSLQSLWPSTRKSVSCSSLLAAHAAQLLTLRGRGPWLHRLRRPTLHSASLLASVLHSPRHRRFLPQRGEEILRSHPLEAISTTPPIRPRHGGAGMQGHVLP